jgi:hypothetical protein
MSEAPIIQCDYGQLRVAIDNGIEWFALAPDATLNDIGEIFQATAVESSRRLISVHISIVSAP